MPTSPFYSAQTLLELSAETKFLGAVPGIIQALHTWGQELNFHPHIHCIVFCGGLSNGLKLKTCGNGFFIPAKVLAAKFRGKFLSSLDALHKAGKLSFSDSLLSKHDTSHLTPADSTPRTTRPIQPGH